VTTDSVHDKRRFRGIVRRTTRKHRVDKVAADPGYDAYKNYELCHAKKIRTAIKPKLNSNPNYYEVRNNNID